MAEHASSVTPTATLAYRLRCGVPALAAEIGKGLQLFGWEEAEQSFPSLLIDAPPGFALQELEKADANVWIVVTDNPCPEYWEDLWSFSPRGLLAGGHSARYVIEALNYTTFGEPFRHTPQYNNLLTHLERQLLNLSAHGWENKRIAKKMDLSEGTVRNGLSRIFQKLNLKNRTQLALYYWGLWHLIDKGFTR